MTDLAKNHPADTGLSPAQRDALVEAHRLGGRFPASWNGSLRRSLSDRGLVELYVPARCSDWFNYRLTEAGAALARRIEGEK